MSGILAKPMHGTTTCVGMYRCCSAMTQSLPTTSWDITNDAVKDCLAECLVPWGQDALTSVAAMPVFAVLLNSRCTGLQRQPLTQARYAAPMRSAGMLLPCMYVTARYLRSNCIAVRVLFLALVLLSTSRVPQVLVLVLAMLSFAPATKLPAAASRLVSRLMCSAWPAPFMK